MDVDRIALGVDFAEVITEAVSTCQVLLAVIGPRWLTATDQDGRRLDDPGDIVRLEIAAALERDIRVIPILVEGAGMPRRACSTNELDDERQPDPSTATATGWCHAGSAAVGRSTGLNSILASASMATPRSVTPGLCSLDGIPDNALRRPYGRGRSCHG